MTRITNAVRERMCTDLLKRRFASAGEALGQESMNLFQRVYEDRYDDEARRLMAKLKRKYRDAFAHNRMIECRAAGFRVDVGAVRLGHEKVTFTPNVEPRPFLNGCGRGDGFKFADCEISQALQDFAAQQVAFVNDIKAAQRELMGALSAVNTDRQLAKLWPEVMPTLSQHMPVASGSNLPAVQFSKLTEAFGLSAEPAS